MAQPQQVNFLTEENFIRVKPEERSVEVGGTVEFYADDANEYKVKILKANEFFETDNSEINETVIKDDSKGTPPVKAPVGTRIGYSVTTPGGGTPAAPPRIIVVS